MQLLDSPLDALNKKTSMTASRAVLPDTLDTLLDRMQYRADPLADRTINDILGPWGQLPDAVAAVKLLASGEASTLVAHWQPQWQKLAAVTQTFAQWTDNGSISGWRGGPGLAPEIAASLENYLQAARRLPDWADPAKLTRAEALFMDYGALSVTMLFCSSLPECYVIPDLAAVLQVTGQLVTHTDHRIRATGAMIFPVMMRGGLTAADGGGVAQIFKVRLIHATIRNLILRSSPAAAMATLAASRNGENLRYAEDAGIVPPLTALAATDNMHQALFAHGWKTGADGLPCNQEELAYTLLTFSYVFLRSMKKLGLPLSREDCEAYLHCWNVSGHMLGIERELMANTMEEAETMFACMQARGRADWLKRPTPSDPRPALGNALMQAMEQVIPISALKPFPVLLTRYLCGPDTSRDLGLNGPISWVSRLLFAGCAFLVRAIDWLVRLVFPEFSIARFLTRVLGYHLITKLLMDETRPLKLPEHVRSGVASMISRWSDDPKAPRWLNSLEDTMTIKDSWNRPAQK